jgi:phosphoribosylanthranilate isomerase
MPTRVKICGITRVEDALCAARLGAHAVGMVFYRHSPRFVDVRRACAISNALPPFVAKVGLFVDAAREEVNAVIDELHLDLLQFHGDEQPDFCSGFGVPFIKAARVRPGLDLLQYARNFSAAGGLLLDSFVAGVPGGTGQPFDWRLIQDRLSLPVILSGGLNPGNVGAAIRWVRPWGVDVSSGVESANGIKDPDKIARFIQGVRDEDLRLT